MKSPIEILEGGLNWFGGYILIPEEYRETSFEFNRRLLADGYRYNKQTNSFVKPKNTQQ